MKGTITVGNKATVWDGEIVGLEGALRMVGNTPVLLLTNSRAAIQAVQKAGGGVLLGRDFFFFFL